ncbi:hypothetical protein TD95_001211 [Thielaviopsis punctulata]|uniref:RNA-dependent RNA polymerase n=1 Tax=Thielaviopsis punctulata TaxID=72032 RepID=A0A0F4ZCJ1_9PEZI|nr:hypothetical protein TD95_001211 [Thielaviopsis punctulata]
MTRSKRGKGRQPPPATEPSYPTVRVTPAVSLAPKRSAGWKSWEGAEILLVGLPPHTAPKDVYSFVRKHGGEISRIEIQKVQAIESDADQRRINVTQASVFYTRLPDIAFWSAGRIFFRERERCWTVAISAFENKMTVSRIKSPATPNVTYPACIDFVPQKMGFGILTHADTVMLMKEIVSDPTDGESFQKIEVDIRRRQIRVFFGIPRTWTNMASRCFKCVVDFDNLRAIYLDGFTPSQPHGTLRVSMLYPPPYYWKRLDKPSAFTPNTNTFDVQNAWMRVCSIGEDHREPHHLCYHNSSKGSAFIDFGRWKTLLISISQIPREEETLNALRDFSMPLVREPSPLRVVPGSINPVWEEIDRSPSTPNNLTMLSMVAKAPQRLPWTVRYQLEVCLTKGVFEEHSINADFINVLAEMGEVEALSLLERAADHSNRSDVPKDQILIPDPMAILQPNNTILKGCRFTTRPRIPHYCALVRKAIVTPTTVYFHTPTIESTNRVLRKFRHVQDHFLRVQFSDELLNGKLSSGNTGNRFDNVYYRVYNVMDEGIRIGERVFKYLACGNSQMRECGAYFFADTPEVTRDDIRAWMGNFEDIRSVAKRAARIGQCFSTTRAVRGVSVPSIKRIPDIEKGKYCFTDGVGKISRPLASLVMEEMELFTAPGEPVPAAYQFRMGGCKGVLVVSDDANGMEVHIRKSQEKFQSDFNALEIIRVSQYSIATLNRQTIVVLSSLGVPDEVFMELLNDQLLSYEKAMVDIPTAMTLLTQYIDENAISLQLAEMVRAGFMNKGQEEPFVMSILNLWRTWSLKLLKEKARIVVPKGAFLLGCVDELGILRGHSIPTEGSKTNDVNKLPQIFVRIPDPKRRGQYVTVEGVCIVGRNPSLHPGDIRVVQAVNVPQLNYLTNVVVFPSTGDRDVPSMLSGGDLDGDDFFVIWDEKLIPPEWNHRPMPCNVSQSTEHPKEFGTPELQMFFVKYLRGDILPVIAHAHLAWADACGAKSNNCLKLAQLHSKAVDYAKSGEPADMPPSLHPKKWPHFMEKKRGASYRSTRPLGVIYDRVQRVEFSPLYTKPMHKGILERPCAEKDLAFARKIKGDYDIEMRRLMGQFEVDTEFEMWTTFVLSKPRIGTGYKMQERIGKEMGSLRRIFRDICIEETGGPGTFETMADLVVAMYKVTHEEITEALSNLGDAVPTPKNMPLMSFPWLFAEWLCKLTLKKDRANNAFPLSISMAAKLRVNMKQRRPLDEASMGLSDEEGDSELEESILSRDSTGSLPAVSDSGIYGEKPVLALTDSSQLPGTISQLPSLGSGLKQIARLSGHDAQLEPLGATKDTSETKQLSYTTSSVSCVQITPVPEVNLMDDECVYLCEKYPVLPTGGVSLTPVLVPMKRKDANPNLTGPLDDSITITPLSKKYGTGASQEQAPSSVEEGREVPTIDRVVAIPERTKKPAWQRWMESEGLL